MKYEQQLGPFVERDATLAEVAMRVMQIEATPKEAENRVELKRFAQELYAAPADIADRFADLNEVHRYSTGDSAKTIYSGYFMTEEGRTALKNIGMEHTINSAAVQGRMAEMVARNQVTDNKAYTALATKSRTWYKRQLADGIVHIGDEDQWTDSPVLYLNLNPDKLLDKFSALQAYRQKYRQMSLVLRQTPENFIKDEKSTVLSIHWATVNAKVAELYPSIVHLAEQLSVSPDTPHTQQWRHAIMQAAPVARHLFNREHLDAVQAHDTFLRRLDLIRNGAQKTDSSSYSSIALADITLAYDIESSANDEEKDEVECLSQDFTHEVESQTWDKLRMQELLSGVLDKWQWLSKNPLASDDEVRKRTGYTEDNKWQIVYTSRVDTLSVDGTKRVMYIPESYNRDGIESLAKCAHELMHVVQNVCADELAIDLPLTKIGGRRRLTGREMGGIYEERRMFAMFGKERSTNTAYLRALEAKEQGVNQLDVARAFYRASEKPADEAGWAKLAAQAADRILRLYRKGGYESRPLDYLEQELSLKSMVGMDPETIRTRAACATSFSLKDAATLHELGLLRISEHLDQHPAEDVLDVYKQQQAVKKAYK